MLKASILSLSDKFWTLWKAGDIVPLEDFAVSGNNINPYLRVIFHDSSARVLFTLTVLPFHEMASEGGFKGWAATFLAPTIIMHDISKNAVAALSFKRRELQSSVHQQNY